MSEVISLHIPLHDVSTRPGLQGSRSHDLWRIETALRQAQKLLKQFARCIQPAELKADGHPVTPADCAADSLLRQTLPWKDEGWLSEESPDNAARLEKHRVWIVDPLDGTKEFQKGICEWCVSIGLIEDQRPIAGGICNPMTGEVFLGSLGTGIKYVPADTRETKSSLPRRPVVLASRSEVERGEWDWLQGDPFEIRSVGSIAYKLALVAAGRADATWTFVPKNEWDIAGGIALVLANGGEVQRLNGKPIAFNQVNTLWDGLIAFSGAARPETIGLLKDRLSLVLAEALLSSRRQQFLREARSSTPRN